MFFKDIYDKTDQYYSNIVNKIYAEVSPLLVRLDKEIVAIQKVEQERAEQQRILDELRQEAHKKEQLAKEAAEKRQLQEKQLAEMVEHFGKLKVNLEQEKSANHQLQEALKTEKTQAQKLAETATKL